MFKKQIDALLATKQEKIDEMKSIAAKAAEEGRSMEAQEAEHFDGLKAQVKQLDSDIDRLKSLADLDVASAEPVENDAKKKSFAQQFPVPSSVKNTEKLEEGIGFARYARVKALSRIENADVIQIAKTLYPKDEKLISSFTKASVPAANTGNAQWAGNLINEGGAAFADFVEYLRPRTLLGRISSNLRSIPFNSPVLIQSTGGRGAWVSEGHAKPATSWTYARTKLAPLKVAALAVATKETLKYSSTSADRLIRDELTRAIGATIDTTFISTAAAVVDESPAGLLNGTVPLTLSSGSTDDDVRCDAQAFMRAFTGANLSLEGAFWIMPERVAIALSLMQNALGQSAFPGMTYNGGVLFGIPVFVSSYAPTTSAGSVVALVKGDEIFLGDEGGIDVSMSDQATIEMDDAPGADSTTPTGATKAFVNLWQTNSVGWIVERYINWSKRRASSVAWGYVTWVACNP